MTGFNDIPQSLLSRVRATLEKKQDLYQEDLKRRYPFAFEKKEETDTENIEEENDFSTWEITWNSGATSRVKARSSNEAVMKAGKAKGWDAVKASQMQKNVKKVMGEEVEELDEENIEQIDEISRKRLATHLIIGTEHEKELKDLVNRIYAARNELTSLKHDIWKNVSKETNDKIKKYRNDFDKNITSLESVLRNISDTASNLARKRQTGTGTAFKKLTKEDTDLEEARDGNEDDDGEGMDKPSKKQLKGKFDDRTDKDIDNDGDSDESDEYLHKRRKAIAKKMKSKKED